MDLAGGKNACSDSIPPGAVVVDNRQETGDLFGFVVELAVETRVPDDAVVTQGLQGTRTDSEHSADIFAVQPPRQVAVVTLACEDIHFLGERCDA